MELLEYQAKQLFRQVGIPVLPSERIDRATQLKHLQIPFPVVLKSQVRAHQRAKAGGIRFVGNTIDAIAAAQAIFSLPIRDQLPVALLAERQYHPVAEYYLAILVDRSARLPVLLGSCAGGIDVESRVESIQQVWVNREFSPYHARRLASQMGLQGDLLLAVAGVIEQMYSLFHRYDLDLVEINPLGVGRKAEVMALDGKVTLNPDAFRRHRELVELLADLPQDRGTSHDLTAQAQAAGMQWVELPGGSVAILCNGAGLTLATMDLLYRVGLPTANFLDIGEQAETLRIQQGLLLLQQFLTQPQGQGVRVLLLNLLGSLASCEAVAELVSQYHSPSAHTPASKPAVVVRYADCQETTAFSLAQERLAQLGIPLCSDLDKAVFLCEEAATRA